GITGGDVLDAFEKQTIAHLHDVRLVHGGDPRPAVTPRVFERELRNARGRLGRDDLQALDDAGHDLMLEARIQVFRVLPDDHEVDALVARRTARDVPHRTQVCEELQRLPQADVDAREPSADGRRQRTFEGDPVAHD